MAKIDLIYESVDDFGLIAASEARLLGFSSAELVQFAHRGKLIQVARGVYRMPVWPYQEAAPYAIAVKATGPEAYLYGESVVAILGLAPTDPSRIWVGSPKRVRKSLDGVSIVDRLPETQTTFYEGVPSQAASGALCAAALTIGPSRSQQATIEAASAGYITHEEASEILETINRAEV